MPRQSADYDPLMDELPPELAAEYKAEKRRQKMAELMMGQSMQPLQAPEVKGRFQGAISPFQGLAQIANAYMARKGLEGSDKAIADIGGRASADRNAAIEKMMQAMAGTPEQVEQLPPDVMGPPQTIPAVPGNIDAGISAGMGSPYTQKIAQAMMLEKMKSQPMMAFKAEESKLAREQRMKELEMRLEDQRLSRADRDALQRDLAQLRLDGQRELKAMGSAIAGAQPVTPITIQDPKDPNATIVIDGRTGKVFGKGPKLTEAGSLENKRRFNMSGLGQTIQEAEDLLTGATGKPLPTGSGVGTAYDAVAGLVGFSPEGSKEAQQLKAVGGALTSKMPRMEGPQSDKDTALYKEMAAVVGDSTVPRERRIAALRTVKSLWEKYEGKQDSQQGSMDKQITGSAKFLGFE